ncbi:hypothetical protein [Fluviispira multicolorata]|uniref:Uncharacterized protein n=1 Tax=Fluviispira multicolorata TaxID=2654512 RepID=A0A833N6D2_9BACT|nr:hypothetical protein [Fluviispira multicolorata]KAB8033265.1 hypothetical protein GCL57_00795 [Fluviispira multicolorata]
MSSFISADFIIPEHFICQSFQLKPLSPLFAAEDFIAIKLSEKEIKYVFGRAHEWPTCDLSFDDNYNDLVRHEKEFNERISFAYAILSPDDGHYLGCLYIMPIKSIEENDLRKTFFNAQAFFWINTSYNKNNLEQNIFTEIETWLKEIWPFQKVAFPGRTVAWEIWEQLEKGSRIQKITENVLQS